MIEKLQFVDEQVESSSDEECVNEYKIGGYHPVHIGEVFHQRYTILQKLGWGQFSTVWLSRDFKNGQFVALKIQKSAPRYLEMVLFDKIQALDEVEILQAIQRKGKEMNIVKLLNAFQHKGPFGMHFVMIFEILGVNLLEILKKYEFKGLHIEQAKSIIRQILLGIDFLHRECGIIHTDLKPENILVCLTKEQIKEIVETEQITQRQLINERIKQHSDRKQTKSEKRKEKQKLVKDSRILSQARAKRTFVNMDKRIFQVKIADLGSACWVHHHFSENICMNPYKQETPKYRAPEVILGQTYGTSVDIWSVACIAFELMTGDCLFDWEYEEAHVLAQIQELLGKFPKCFSCVGTLKNKYFNCEGELRYAPRFRAYSIRRLLIEKYQMNPVMAKEFDAFLQPMLNPIGYLRATASQMLRHPWLTSQSPVQVPVLKYDYTSDERESSDSSMDEPIIVNKQWKRN